jgi:hypothetical protein
MLILKYYELVRKVHCFKIWLFGDLRHSQLNLIWYLSWDTVSKYTQNESLAYWLL